MNMRIAVGSRFLADRPAVEIVALARRLRADGVEFHLPHLARAIEQPDDPGANLADVCAESGLALIGTGIATLTAPQEDGLPEIVSMLCEQTAAASRFGIPAVTFTTGSRECVSFEALLRCMRRIVAIGEASHVRIELANQLGSRLEQLEDFRRLIASLQLPGARLRVDAGEFHAAAVNPRDVLAEFGDLASSVVISDRRGREEVPLGQGQVNLAGVVGDLTRMGYDGWLVVHLRGDETEQPANPVDYVRELGGGGKV